MSGLTQNRPPSFSWSILTLIMAGEAIFFLPFVLPRVFRQTVLDFLQIDNTQLGSFFSVYGLVAFGAYLIGGPLADRFPANRLLAIALVSTALGGLVLATSPPIDTMRWLYGFWGFSTICLFWAALFRATRLIFSPARQGIAFGLLDGGRGLFAAVVSSALVLVYGAFLPNGAEKASQPEKIYAFQQVLYTVVAIVFGIGVLAFCNLRKLSTTRNVASKEPLLPKIKRLAALPSVWLQAGIILCAYSGYKITDDFSLLAQDALGYDEVQAASVTSFSLWLRLPSALLAGWLADKVKASSMILVCFVLLLGSGLTMALDSVSSFVVVVSIIASTSIAVFALRGLYFAVMEEGKIPRAVTGTAVGLASIIGYLPDVYMGPLMGHYLDKYEGMIRHQKVFLCLAIFAAVGIVFTLVMRFFSQKLERSM